MRLHDNPSAQDRGRRRLDPMLGEIFYGAVYGLGISALVWSLAASPGLGPATLALASLAALVAFGASRRSVPGGLLTHPFVLAALMAGGAGASVAVAASAAAIEGAIGFRRPGAGVSRWAFRVGRASVAALMASGCAHLLGRGEMAGTFWPLLAHACTYHLAELTLNVLESKATGKRPIPGISGETAWRLGAVAAGPVLAIGLVTTLGDERFRPWVAGAALAHLVHLVWQGYHRRREARRPAVDAAVIDTVVEAIAEASSTRGGKALPTLHRLRVTCSAVGSRLGMSSHELRSLELAAMLHEAGRIALPDGDRSVRLHPRAGNGILASIKIPQGVRVVLENVHLTWDGAGRADRLRGEWIPLGSRILATVLAYDDARDLTGPIDAMSRLRAESGRRFDPVIVDLVEEQVATDRSRRDRAVSDRTDRNGTGSLSRADGELDLLYTIGRFISGGLDLRDALSLISTRLREIVPHEGLALFEVEETTGSLVVRASIGCPASAPGVRHPLDDAAEGSSTEQAIRDWCDDHVHAIRRGHEVNGMNRTFTAWTSPLGSGPSATGALVVYLDPENPLSADDRRVLDSVAVRVTDGLRSRGPLSAGAGLTDPGTGLPGSGFLRRVFSSTRQRKTPSRFGLIALEMRDASRLHRQLGTPGYDREVAKIARTLARDLDGEEILVRYGPAQFVLVTPEWRPDGLVRRWDALTHTPDTGCALTAAHACHPEDGHSLEALLATLGRRLELARQRPGSVRAFRASGSTG